MPVHPVPGGWRWGNSGKVYKSKKKAERQARAIYASGYRESGRPSPPGWSGEIGVDFSAAPIAGTNCANCRSLLPGLHCANSDFVRSAIPKQRKIAGDNRIPVSSGDPHKYCCNFWGLSKAYARSDRADAKRPSKHKIHTALSAPARAEARYVLDLQAILRGVHRGVMAALERDVLVGDDLRTDAETPRDRAKKVLTPRLANRIADHVRDPAGEAFDRMVNVVDDNAEETATLVGIALTDVPGLSERVAAARDWNISLVENAGRAYADDVRDIFDDPDNFGLRVEDLRDVLLERGNVSESRAALIARDQTLKTNAAITQARQTAAGVKRYTWSTSHDERVRPSHAELDGQEFDWDDPPETNDDGETNHPGEDYQCRCVAIPVIEELEEPDEGDDDPIEALP